MGGSRIKHKLRGFQSTDKSVCATRIRYSNVPRRIINATVK